MSDRVYLSSCEYGVAWIELTDGDYTAAVGYLAGITIFLDSFPCEVDVRSTFGKMYDEEVATQEATVMLTRHYKRELQAIDEHGGIAALWKQFRQLAANISDLRNPGEDGR